jgi:hypothetical protein
VVGICRNDQHIIHLHIRDHRLTQEWVGHRTQEEGGKARLAEIQEGGTPEVPLARHLA